MKAIIFGMAIGVVITYLCAGNSAQIPAALITIAAIVLIVMLIGTAANYLRTIRTRGRAQQLLDIIAKGDQK